MVYLPTDYGTLDSFTETLAELDGFLLSHSYDNIIICGDFNNCGGRNCEHLHSFMHEHNFVCADMNSCIKYTYRRDDHTSFSWPDHVLTLALHVLSPR